MSGVSQSERERLAQARFYSSKQWRHIRDNYKRKMDFECERCGRMCYERGDPRYKRARAQGDDVLFGIVHHKEHLTSETLNDAMIALEESNLELLCISCHNTEHFGGKRKKRPAELRADIAFDENGDMIHNE